MSFFVVSHLRQFRALPRKCDPFAKCSTTAVRFKLPSPLPLRYNGMMELSQLSGLLHSHHHRGTSEMSDSDLMLWLNACRFMVPYARTTEARQVWSDRLAEAENEIRNRSAGNC